MTKYPSIPCSYYLTDEASEARLLALITRLVRESVDTLSPDFFKVPGDIQLRVLQEIENDRD